MEFDNDFLMLQFYLVILLQQGRTDDIFNLLIIEKMISPVNEANISR